MVSAWACPGSGPGSGSVGDPYCSIQIAIDNALDMDEIVVAPGTYFETIDFLGNAVTLWSSASVYDPRRLQARLSSAASSS